MLENRKKLLGEAAFVLLVFFVMLAFFSEVHPVVMYDGDDWNGLSKQRNILCPLRSKVDPPFPFLVCSVSRRRDYA